MKDFIQKYKKTTFVHNLSIIGVSCMLAVLIHFSLGDSNFGKSVKSSVIDATESSKNTGDIYLALVNNGESIEVKSGSDIAQVSKLALSLSYSPDGVKINSIIPTDTTTTIENLANEPGFQTIFFLFPTPKDIKSGDTIVSLQVSKLSQKVEYINLISVNTENSTKEIKELSSSGIDF